MNALLVVPRLPGTGFTGDRVRAAQHLAALRLAGFKTVLVGGLPRRCPLPSIEGVEKIVPVPLLPWAIARGIAAAGLRGDPLQTGLVAGDWRNAVRRAGDPFDLVVVVLARIWPHLEGLLPAAPVVLDYVDALGAGAKQAAREDPALWRRLYWKGENSRLERLEARAGARAALRLATTEADAAALPRPTLALPLGVAVEELTESQRPQVVGFSGRLGYRPNELALRRLVDRIWPRVLLKLPEAELRIGGADPPRWIRSLSKSSRVVVESPVSDMKRFLRGVSVVVAPVLLGSGAQLKLFEAMEAGATVVASPEVVVRGAVAGFPLPIRVATSDSDFADQIVTLLREPTTAALEGAAARRFVIQHADRDVFTGELARLYEKVVAG